MRYGSVCSGIEAASVAWHPLGWQPAFFSEIEAFPRAVLAHRFPDVPLHGDFTTIGANQYGPIDLLVGGTPCQSFSIAGLRGGLDDDRGNLALEFLRLADRTRARWVVWENVPGVLSSNGGRDFGSILGGLGKLGYGWAYRVLDAQFFGVAQRRRRVFVVGHLGDWRRAAAVLFERHSLSGHPAPRRETGERVADSLTVDANQCSGFPGDFTECQWPADIAPTLNAAFGSKQGLEDQHIRGGQDYLSLAQCPTTGTGQRYDAETETLIPTHGGGFDVIAFSKGDHGADAGMNVCPTIRKGGDGGGNMPAIAFAIQAGALRENANCGPGGVGVQSDHAYTLEARAEVQAVAFALRGRDDGAMPEIHEGGDSIGALRAANGGSSRDYVAFGDTARTLSARHDGSPCADRRPDVIAQASAVRRLTPKECERLQGFSDNFTAIPYRGKPADQCPDGPRYKALGNSMAVPVMRWIGERIQLVDAITAMERAA